MADQEIRYKVWFACSGENNTKEQISLLANRNMAAIIPSERNDPSTAISSLLKHWTTSGETFKNIEDAMMYAEEWDKKNNEGKKHKLHISVQF